MLYLWSSGKCSVWYLPLLLLLSSLCSLLLFQYQPTRYYFLSYSISGPGPFFPLTNLSWFFFLVLFCVSSFFIDHLANIAPLFFLVRSPDDIRSTYLLFLYGIFWNLVVLPGQTITVLYADVDCMPEKFKLVLLSYFLVEGMGWNVSSNLVEIRYFSLYC